MIPIYKATVENDLREMNGLIDDLNLFLNAHDIQDRLFYEVNLAIEEHLVNIFKFGSKEERRISVQIEVSIKPENIVILLTDDGKRFNPLSVPHLDIKKPPTERSSSGLGMHLVRNIMQSMWYERKEGKNIFQIQIERQKS